MHATVVGASARGRENRPWPRPIRETPESARSLSVSFARGLPRVFPPNPKIPPGKAQKTAFMLTEPSIDRNRLTGTGDPFAGGMGARSRWPTSAGSRCTAPGFSLVELLTVLGLLGLALAVVTPSMADLYRRRATQHAANEFITTHRLTRSAALRLGRVTELHIDPARGNFWIEADTGQGIGARDTLTSVRWVGVSGVSLSSDRTTLCFDLRGLPTARGACEAADAVVIFSQGDRSDTVRISALGKVLR